MRREDSRLAAVCTHVLANGCSPTWLQQQMLLFANQLGFSVFDVYVDSNVGAGQGFPMLEQLERDAKRGCFDTVIVLWLPCMADDPDWADHIRCLLELDIQMLIVAYRLPYTLIR